MRVSSNGFQNAALCGVAATKICTLHSKHRQTSLTCLTRSRKCADVSKFHFLTSRADIEQLSVSGLASASGVKSAPAAAKSVQAECLSENQRKLPLPKSSSYPLASSSRREKFKGNSECKSSALPRNEMDLLKGPAAAGWKSRSKYNIRQPLN